MFLYLRRFEKKRLKGCYSDMKAMSFATGRRLDESILIYR